jgi:carbamoyl-phosphate synthase large subunit
MKNLNILLLGAGNRISLCEWLIEAGAKHNRKVNIYSMETDKYVPISKYATIIDSPRWKDAEFKEALFDYINQYQINLVLPLMDAGTVELSRFKEEIISLFPTWPVVSSFNLCEIFNDKILSDCWFNQNNILVPKLNPATFPRIYKMRYGYGSRNLKLIHSPKELELFSLSSHVSLDNYMCQEYISGTEYTVDAYCDRSGKYKAAVSRIRLTTVNGEVTRTITEKNEELLNQVEAILSIPGFEGPITLQAIKSGLDGKFYWIEINPRFGGGAICSMKAGANYCDFLISEYLGKDLPENIKWTDGLLMTRAWQEVWHYTKEKYE